MGSVSRRKFIKTGALGAAAAAAAPVLTGFEKVLPKLSGEMIFKPYPHPWMPKMDFAYAADEKDDPIKSGVKVASVGIVVPKILSWKSSQLIHSGL